jgi:hypothetical protein
MMPPKRSGMPPKHFGMTQKGAAPFQEEGQGGRVSFRCEIARSKLDSSFSLGLKIPSSFQGCGVPVY